MRFKILIRHSDKDDAGDEQGCGRAVFDLLEKAVGLENKFAGLLVLIVVRGAGLHVENFRGPRFEVSVATSDRDFSQIEGMQQSGLRLGAWES